MTNTEIKKRAQELFIKGMGFSVPLTKIRLLEADMSGDYIFFAVGKVSYIYYRLSDSLEMYPSTKCVDGMMLNIKEV